MPLYEYKCEKGHVFEVMQSFSDEALSKCEECGAPAQRVLHAPAVHFKGKGFYNTDYGTRKRQREKAASKSSKSESGSDSASKSSKPDSGSSGSKKSDSASKPKKSSD